MFVYTRLSLKLFAVASAACVMLVITAIRPISAQALSPGDFARVQQLFREANSAMAGGDAPGAVQKYTEAIGVAPGVPGLYLNRGIAYVSLSKLDDASADAEKAIELFTAASAGPKELAIAYQLKGLAFQSKGDHVPAIEYYGKAIQLDPSNAKYLNGRGNSLRLMERYDEAAADYTAAISLDPKLSQPLINRGSVYRKQNKLDAALRDFEEALKLEKTNGALYLNRGNLYFDQGKYAEALADYSQAISLKSKSEYFYARGRLYIKQKRYELGIADNTEAINLDSTNAEAYRNRSVAYSALGKHNLALEDVKKAVLLKPNSIGMRYNLGYLLFKAGHFAPAVVEATNTIKLDPRWKAPYQLRAAAYSKLGNVRSARADQEQAAKLNASYVPEADDIFFFELGVGDFGETKH
jgi:tetratricopeptide (TPR) repeat protein